MRYTTVRVDEETWKRIKSYSNIGESNGDVVRRLCDEHDAPKPELSQFTVELTQWEFNKLMAHRKDKRSAVLSGPSSKTVNDTPRTVIDIEIAKYAEETGQDFEVLRKEHQRIMREQISGARGAFNLLKSTHKKPEDRE